MKSGIFFKQKSIFFMKSADTQIEYNASTDEIKAGIPTESPSPTQSKRDSKLVSMKDFKRQQSIESS